MTALARAVAPPPSLTELNGQLYDALNVDGANVNLSVEAVDPPALIVGWGPDTWVDRITACVGFAVPSIICVAGRVTPEAGVQQLQQLVPFTVVRLAGWPVDRVEAPTIITFSAVDYLTARVVLAAVPVSFDGDAAWPAPPPVEEGSS